MATYAKEGEILGIYRYTNSGWSSWLVECCKDNGVSSFYNNPVSWTPSKYQGVSDFVNNTSYKSIDQEAICYAHLKGSCDPIMYIASCGGGYLVALEVASGYLWESVFIRKKYEVTIH